MPAPVLLKALLAALEPSNHETLLSLFVHHNDCDHLVKWMCWPAAKVCAWALGGFGSIFSGRVYRVASPVWVWRSEGAELGHGVSTLPMGEGSLNRLYSPVLLPGDVIVRVEEVKTHFAPTGGGWIAEPIAMILSGSLRGQQVTLGTDGSWSVMDRDEQNQVTIFKPKPGKVIRL